MPTSSGYGLWSFLAKLERFNCQLGCLERDICSCLTNVLSVILRAYDYVGPISQSLFPPSGQTSGTLKSVELTGSIMHLKFSANPGCYKTSCMKVNQYFVQKSGCSERSAKEISTSFRKSSAQVHKGKSSVL